MIKVLIIDDHPIVRQGLRQVLKETSDIVVIGEAGNSSEALSEIAKNDCDVALLDISMPGRNGLDILRQLKIERPDLHLLILSTYPEEQYAVRALQDGADGYLTKASAPDELVAAIRKAAMGGKYVSSTLAEKLAFALDTNTQRPLHENLSDREFEVMCMIASGKTVKEIAAALSLSIKTISTYRARILEKTHMKNNAEITLYAVKQGLVN
jgi:DNA-binding NarL/FixJ family response regulator